MRKISQETYYRFLGNLIREESVFFHKELDWFYDEAKKMMAVIIEDNIDKDYSAVIHKQNFEGKYEHYKQATNFKTEKDALKWIESESYI